MFVQEFSTYKLPLLENGVRLPNFRVEIDDKNEIDAPLDINNYDFLCALTRRGFEEKILPKYSNNPDKLAAYQERIDLELNTFKDLGFVDYLLITWDILNFCKNNRIPRGAGRGSACGSLILYLINVTQIDSLEAGCYFERFLNKTRAKFNVVDGVCYYDGSLLMDVDIDIGFLERAEVIVYLNKKYKGQIAKLLTVNTFSTKILIKEAAKFILNATEEEANRLSDMIPKEYGQVKSIQETCELVPNFKKFADENPFLIQNSNLLYELNRHFGVHPSAWIIAAEPIENIFPLQLTKENDIVVGYTMGDALNLAIKVDVLSLRSATLLYNVCRSIHITPEEINVHDQSIYDNYQNLFTPHGIFQIEADCNFRVLKSVKPKNFDQLAAVLSLARPGALQFVDSYSEYVNSGNYISYDEYLDPILKKTGGVCLYQETVLEIGKEVFGMDLVEAENLRRAIGKKDKEKMSKFQDVLKTKAKEKNLPQSTVDKFWQILEDSAKYSFNFSHAAAYSHLSASTTYLKFKYPQHFYLELLKLARHEPQPVVEIEKIQRELKYFGIELLPPHVLKSDSDYKIEGKNIRMGLSGIKGVSDAAIEKLKSFHPSGEVDNKFELFQSASQCKIPINIIGSLVLCGAMDDLFPEKRAVIWLELCLWNILTDKERSLCIEFGHETGYCLIKLIKHLNSKTKNLANGKLAQLIKDSRLDTLRDKFNPYHSLYKFNIQNEELMKYQMEKRLLGYSYTTTLFNIFNPLADNLMTIEDINNHVIDTHEKFRAVGEVTWSKSDTSKSGTPYYKFVIKDHTGEIKCMIFNTARKKGIDETLSNNGKLPEEGDVVVVHGTKPQDGGVIFCETIGIQDVKIFDKVSQLKKHEDIKETPAKI